VPQAFASQVPQESVEAGQAQETSLAEDWRRAVEALRATMPRHGKSLTHARFLGFTPDGVRIAFSHEAGFHRAQVLGMRRILIEAELGKSLARPIKLIEDTDGVAFNAAPKSIAEVEANIRASLEKVIEKKVQSHPSVHAVLRHLGGVIEHIQYLNATRPNALSETDYEHDED